MFCIRADANEVIGTGHMMRCLSIAEELQRRGEKVTFVVADERSKKLINESYFRVICLHSVWDNLEMEIDDLAHVLKGNEVSCFLIDSYYVTDSYLRTVGRYAKIAYMDDRDAFIYPVDLLIDYNIYADVSDYADRYQQAGLGTRFLMGIKYAPLRNEFTGVQRKIRKSVSKILITSGGADAYNAVGNILSIFESQSWFSQMEYEIILGKFNVHIEYLKERWKRYKNIHLLQNVFCMSDYMATCDVAVTAGGVTTYELCACGIPSVMYTLADNQLQIAKTVSEREVIPWAGDVRYGMAECMEKIVRQIGEYISDIGLRRDKSQKMQELVDGQGCKRLADELQSMI